MDAKYQQWINENVEGDGYGHCREITESMVAVFPELTRCRGYYYDCLWGERTHWWLKDNNGKIIDPTKAQFPSKGNGPYAEWKEGDPIQTGVCMDCGEPVYDGATFCNEECEAATRAYLARYDRS